MTVPAGDVRGHMVASPTVPGPQHQTLGGRRRRASREHSGDGTVLEPLRPGAPLPEGPTVLLVRCLRQCQHWECWWGTPHPKPVATTRDNGQRAPRGLPATSSRARVPSAGGLGPHPQPITRACHTELRGQLAWATQP